MRLWQCPGPMSLLRKLCDVVADGSSVILRVPQLGPTEIEEEVANALCNQGWYLTTLDDDGSAPARQVLKAAEQHQALAREVNATTLLECEALAGRVFSCVPKTSGEVAQWIDFLDKWVAACRARPNPDRPRFILWLYGDLACPTPAKRLGIEVFDVGAAFTHSDTLLLAYHQACSVMGDSLKSQVVAQTAASLALWDHKLLVRLIDEPPARLFKPVPLLQDYAREVGWDERTPKSWQSGISRMMHGKEVAHSAYLSLNGTKDIVASRVWSGQAAVLLPAIERERLQLISDHHAFLSKYLPIETDYNIIRDSADLEIGHVAWLLKNKQGSGEAWKRAIQLKNIRNDLAHLSPVSPEDVFSLGGA